MFKINMSATIVKAIRKNNKFQILLVAIGFGIIGVTLLHFSRAATPEIAVEPENGTLTGATVLYDTAASGGKAIKFGSDTVTPPTAVAGIWLSQTEVKALPISGTVWTNVLNAANGNWGTASIANQDSTHDTSTLAGALVAARNGDLVMKTKVKNAIMSAIGTESGGRTLAVGRNLSGYVIAADLIDLKTFSPADDTEFRNWLGPMRTKIFAADGTLNGTSIVGEAERRATNWGFHCLASVAAASVYLGDKSTAAPGLGWAWKNFQGVAGNRAVYVFPTPGTAGVDMQSWSEAGAYRPINRVGFQKSDSQSIMRNLDGSPPDMYRGGTFGPWPPGQTDYGSGGMAGIVAAAEILHRQGYASYAEQDKAVLRAYQFLDRLTLIDPYWDDEFMSGNDSWQRWIVNKRYGTNFPVVSPTRPGMNTGWTDWTHAK